MLNLNSLKPQINSMVAYQKKLRSELSERMKLALSIMSKYGASCDELVDKINRGNVSFNVARPLSAPDRPFPPPERPPKITVISADGSQLFPDRHQVSSCYLINLGWIVLRYGTAERPESGSEPLLFYREEDMFRSWGGRRISVNAELVSIRRSILELEKLLVLASGELSTSDVPLVPIADGTLIFWYLDGTPPDFREDCLGRVSSIFERFRELGVPISGYISHPGSSDVVNLLRLGLCPEDPPDCGRCRHVQGRGQLSLLPGREAPCEGASGVTDQLLYSHVLNAGERSAAFESSSEAFGGHGPHRIAFFYINVGSEVARVEVPLWVAEDPGLLDLVHSAIWDQVRKGRGYPVSLSEAHERAVVRGRDRDLFYSILRDLLVEHDIRVRLSAKGLRKLKPLV